MLWTVTFRMLAFPLLVTGVFFLGFEHGKQVGATSDATPVYDAGYTDGWYDGWSHRNLLNSQKGYTPSAVEPNSEQNLPPNEAFTQPQHKFSLNSDEQFTL